MRKIENRFGAVVELRCLGPEIVHAKVSASLRLDRFDSATLGYRILLRLLPEGLVTLRCDDGSYVILDGTGEFGSVAETCVPVVDRNLEAIDFVCELEDGKHHAVHISLSQFEDSHRDYSFAGVRYIELRGTVSIEVDEDEIYEE